MSMSDDKDLSAHNAEALQAAQQPVTNGPTMSPWQQQEQQSLQQPPPQQRTARETVSNRTATEAAAMWPFC